jgi:hypothetical protein
MSNETVSPETPETSALQESQTNPETDGVLTQAAADMEAKFPGDTPTVDEPPVEGSDTIPGIDTNTANLPGEVPTQRSILKLDVLRLAQMLPRIGDNGQQVPPLAEDVVARATTYMEWMDK